MAFCLPIEESKKFLEAVKSGVIDPEKLIDMTSKARHELFEGIVGKENAKEINALVESKLLLKDVSRGMVTAAKQILGESHPALKDFASRVANMDTRILDPKTRESFYQDLASKKMGTEVTFDEAKKITELSQKAQTERSAPTTNLSGVSDEFLKAAGELKSYVDSLTPVSAATSIGKNAAIIARNNLLLNPSTPIKTTIGQFVNSAMDLFTRRIGTLSLKGSNYDLVRQANSEAWQTFRKTGLNTASMESLDDTGKLGEGKRFEQPTGMLSKNALVRGVESTVRKVAQISNKVAIDWEHNIAFTKFYQKAFFDTVNVFSSKVAEGDRAKATEIFKDASRIKPETDIGAMVRLEAQKQAARVTSTNSTFIGNLSISVKDALNKQVTGLGDALMPIAKIPSNIIWNGIENAGVGIPHGAVEVYRGLLDMRSEDSITRYKGMASLASGIQRIARTVGVMGTAAYFASQLTPQDFKQDRYGANYVRIAGVWVNMEYVNAISPALAGMMEIKKNSKLNEGIIGTSGRYVAGTMQGLKNAPLVSDINDLVNAVTNTNYTKGIQKYASTFFTSRGEPAFLRQLQNGQGIKGLLFSTTGLPTQQELKKLGAK